MTEAEAPVAELDPLPTIGDDEPRTRARRSVGPFEVLRGRPWVLALVTYALIGLIANYPSWPGDPSRLASCVCGGNEDPAQTAWFLAWTPFALLHGHNVFLSAWINLPKGANLATNTGMPLLGIVTAPLTLLAGPLASENLLRFLAFPLSAFSMFFVLRHWVRWQPAAFAGGLLYGFSPYMVGQGSVHLNLSFVPLPPLILYALYEIAVTQHRSVIRAGVLLGVLGALQFYVSAEILATTTLTGAIALVLAMIVRPDRVPGHALHALGALAVGAAVLAALVAYPVDVLTRGPQHYAGPSQGPTEVFNADLVGPILPTPAELFAPHRLAKMGSTLVGGRADIDENGSYLGLPLLALTLYLALRYWRRRWTLFALLLGVVMFVLSLGPRLVVNGVAHRPPIRLPFTYLQHVPLLEDILPARLALYVTFFLAVVLAHGLDAFRSGIAERRARPPARNRMRHRVAVGTERLVVVSLVLAAIVALLPRWPYASRPGTLPPAEQAAALSAIPVGASVLTYPYATPFTDDAMLWQADDAMRFKIFGSYILRPGVGNRATPLPAELSPLDVQAMLSTTLSTIAIPGLPYLAPSSRTIVATKIVVERGRPHKLRGPAPTIAGVVENVNPATGAFYVITKPLELTGVTLTATTRFVEPVPVSPLLRVMRAEHVAVYGRAIAGTLTPQRVRDLRTFLRDHHVNAVIVALGRVDSGEVARWVRDALGAPTRVLSGGALWFDVPRLLQRTSRRFPPNGPPRPPHPTRPAPPG